MTLGQWMLIMLVVFALAGGQILFKLAALKLAGAGIFVASAIVSPLMLTALVVYGLATALWILILRSVPLSIAYPVVALTFIIVPVLSHWILEEPLRVSTLVGGATILLGVWISVGLD